MSYKEHMKGYRNPRTVCHIDRLYAWKHHHFFAPATVEISPINVCNQKCRYCYVHEKSGGIKKDKGLSHELFADIIKQCGELGVGGILLQGTGEPLLHKGVPSAIREAAKFDMPVKLTTNGVLLDGALAEEILPHLFSVRISNLEMDEKRYTYIHDCPESHYKKLIHNIQNAVRLREDRKLSFSLYSTVYLEDDTLDNMVEYLKSLKALGIDYVIVTEAFWTSGAFDDKKPTSDQTMRDKTQRLNELLAEANELRDDSFEFICRFMVQKESLTGFSPDKWVPDYCDGVKFYVTISSDGEVYPCWRFWGNTDYSYGNLNTTGFQDILQSAEAQNVYRYLNSTPPESDECTVCAIPSLNGILHQLKEPTPWQNFL